MIDGFYGIYYTGLAGSGFGVVVMLGGAIHGADVTGGTFSGHYNVSEQGVTGELTLQVPAGTALVTGHAAQTADYTLTFPLRLPPDLGGGQPVLVQTPTGPINVIIKKLAPWKA